MFNGWLNIRILKRNAAMHFSVVELFSLKNGTTEFTSVSIRKN